MPARATDMRWHGTICIIIINDIMPNPWDRSTANSRAWLSCAACNQVSYYETYDRAMSLYHLLSSWLEFKLPNFHDA